jgi:CubicO group peptidase (beta-lactamase class C family)
MTSGLNEQLEVVAEPGAAWFYNTPAYHFLMRVVESVTGSDRNSVTREWLTGPLGMDDSNWTARPFTDAAIGSGFSTTARDLSRFGLMIQAGGRWGDRVILRDVDYLREMQSPSQAHNPAYGYLWWLNGQEFSRAPGADARRAEGPLIESAPPDLVALQGALDRKLYLVPSLNLIVVRLGAAGAAGGTSFNNAFWQALMRARL